MDPIKELELSREVDRMRLEWNNSRREVRKHVNEFCLSIEGEFARERRLEFLDLSARNSLKEISTLQKLKLKLPAWLWDECELTKVMMRYKKFIAEIHSLKFGTNTFCKKRIDDDTIDSARKISIESLVDCDRISLAYDRIKIKCPFHNEKTPSFIIYTHTNSWHCFGCGLHGNGAIDFIMKYKEMSFPQAINFLVGS